MSSYKKGIAILGSTGSIGTQALEVLAGREDLFRIELLTAWGQGDRLIEQARCFRPNAVVIGDEKEYEKVRNALFPLGVKVYAGEDALEQAVEMDDIDIVLSALVGFSGFKPTLRAIQKGKDIALANKETLVVAGDPIIREAKKHGARIIPVDSEHSAIFQCLNGESLESVEKVFLTASGGPFRGKTRDQLEGVTREEALDHPTWEMGQKISIDSATLMNKGLEVIEASWLFDLPAERIDVLVHPQSVVHSLVQFRDGAMKAEMGVPDMKQPILYALGFPQRLPLNIDRLDFSAYDQLTFERPDTDTFRNLAFAFNALKRGGNVPCVLNAANEVAVHAFLEGTLGFLTIFDVIGECMEKIDYVASPDVDDLLRVDQEARNMATERIEGKTVTFGMKK